VTKPTPHILVTNDDGIGAPGLRAVVESLRAIATVSVVAPHTERSASSQCLTLRQPIFVEQVAEREWSVEGTPADAMIVALHKLLPERPDLVISGINPGPNLGENIFYSGTVGAAMEGPINRVPAFAISVMRRRPSVGIKGAAVFTTAAAFARNLAELILRQGMPGSLLLNVNVPAEWNGKVRLTRQSKKITRTALLEGSDPRGRTYYWIHEDVVAGEPDADSDYAAISSGAISITPLDIDRTHSASLDHLAHWPQLLEKS
jgi:5'-nucleotidase